MVAMNQTGQMGLFFMSMEELEEEERLQRIKEEEQPDPDTFIPEREFSVADQERLHVEMLNEVLQTLFRAYEPGKKHKSFHINATAMCEALVWIYRPDVINGVRSVELPFTYQSCCRIYGVRPDAMQEAISVRIEFCRNMSFLVENGYHDFLTGQAREAAVIAAQAYPMLQRISLRYHNLDTRLIESEGAPGDFHPVSPSVFSKYDAVPEEDLEADVFFDSGNF
jgi:hypothetical protein